MDMRKGRAFGLGLLLVTLVSCAAVAAQQAGVGGASCDVVLDYVATSPPYTALFAAFVEGYLAGEKTSSGLADDDRDVAALMAKAIDYCKTQRSADFESAIAAVAKK
jgi:ABC-type nitrate/sulfonate/bicarbonate transport system substrate-binding protein